MSQLMWAAYRGDLDAVRNLVTPQNVNEREEESGLTAICFASLGGHLDVARCLLESGAEVNSVPPPLRGAKDVAMVLLLVAAGAGLDDVFEDETPLTFAVSEKRNDIARALVAAGASLQGALNSAACSGNSEMVEFLLSKGAKPDEQTVMHAECWDEHGQPDMLIGLQRCSV